MRKRRNKKKIMPAKFEVMFSQLIKILNPNKCYRVDARGSVLPTSMFWISFALGFTSLFLVLFNIITGNLAASVLGLVIVMSILVFNAAKVAGDYSRRKILQKP